MNQKLKHRVILAVIMCIILGVFFAVCQFFVSPNARYHASSNLTDYSRIFGRTHPCNCLLFPDSTLLSDKNCEFYDVFWQNGYDTPMFLTYVRCSFSQEVFQMETGRLRELAQVYSEDYFETPAYILYYNPVGFQEYALVDEHSGKIDYICCSAGRFLKRLPIEDRIKPEFAALHVPYPATA